MKINYLSIGDIENEYPEVREYLAKTYNVPEVLEWEYDYIWIGYDGCCTNNGVHGVGNASYFENGASRISIEEFRECTTPKSVTTYGNYAVTLKDGAAGITRAAKGDILIKVGNPNNWAFYKNIKDQKWQCNNHPDFKYFNTYEEARQFSYALITSDKEEEFSFKVGDWVVFEYDKAPEHLKTPVWNKKYILKVDEIKGDCLKFYQETAERAGMHPSTWSCSNAKECFRLANFYEIPFVHEILNGTYCASFKSFWPIIPDTIPSWYTYGVDECLSPELEPLKTILSPEEDELPLVIPRALNKVTNFLNIE